MKQIYVEAVLRESGVTQEAAKIRIGKIKKQIGDVSEQAAEHAMHLADLRHDWDAGERRLQKAIFRKTATSGLL